MWARVFWVSVLATSLFGASSGAQPAGVREKFRGVCWEASGPIGEAELAPLREAGVAWISQTPFGWAPSLTGTEIRFAADRGLWGETDEGLVKTATLARAMGIKSLLKPHLWVRHGAWQGDIAMTGDADWAAWFASYEKFILHYAALAEANKFEAFAVGTELSKTTRRTAEWRRLIGRVRKVYHGQLTYCANWNGEPEAIEFWSDLDFIGVQAYYPVASEDAPAKPAIAAAWPPIAAKLEALARRTGKRIVFTEIGYKSHTGALKQPWTWERSGDVDVELQRDAFAAMFESLWSRPWFGGTFVWKWHPSPPPAARSDRDFTPQGKPAMSVIRSFYTAS